MFVLAILFLTVMFLYVIYGIVGRKLTIKDLDKKAVLITGCGSGFGRGLVERCLQNGLTVFAGCEFESNIEELERSYSSISQGRLYAIHMNVTDDDSVQKSRKFVDSVLQEKNLVFHALINNAGISGNVFYDDFLVLNDYKEVWDVNMLGALRVTRTFRDLIKKFRGRIVMCISAYILFDAPGHGPYSSSKNALHAYATVIRHELHPYGADVIEILPGRFKTEMSRNERIFNMIDTVWHRAPKEMCDEYGKDFKDKAKTYVKELNAKTTEKDVTWVIDAYYEAIVAKRPKILYRIGWDSLILYYPYSLLPVRLQLYVMKMVLYLSGAPLPMVLEQITRFQNTECKTD
uniref:Uncharacterized protein n=1 Tax=Setaria digitata TaxID=48799 RepID=A0A915Q6N1_9BILA